MEQRIKAFLDAWEAGAKNHEELRELYKEVTGKSENCIKDTCINKMLTAVKKNYHLTYVSPAKQTEAVEGRKYTLKPGNHGFAPNGPAAHNNDNTTDAEIEFYLRIYPHIKHLLV